jgi:hypothetical protein
MSTGRPGTRRVKTAAVENGSLRVVHSSYRIHISQTGRATQAARITFPGLVADHMFVRDALEPTGRLH